ncbi:MAG: DUF1289 domain-containing protein [Burkholderiales bacterium]
MPEAVPVLVPSPCINVCRMNPTTGWCEGCKRSLDEIARWSVMPEAEKRWVWSQLPMRTE